MIFRELDNRKTEPIELCVVEAPNEHVGAVMERMGARRAVCAKMEQQSERTYMEFTIRRAG